MTRPTDSSPTLEYSTLTLTPDYSGTSRSPVSRSLLTLRRAPQAYGFRLQSFTHVFTPFIPIGIVSFRIVG